eukprot:m.227360 g.227360  ORF g.227360 m.227360 type:complete len:766 (+) comp19236_c0_seq1:129-2426(+)
MTAVMNGVTLMLLASFVTVNAHMEFFCVSSIFTNQTEHCNRAVIWLGTYTHPNIVATDPIPGKAIVYRGASPVSEEPFTFEKYCANSTSSDPPFTIGSAANPPTVREIENLIKSLTADDCLPDMDDAISQIRSDMNVTCYTDFTDEPAGYDDSARCPSGEEELFALIPIVLDQVDSSQDIRVLIHSASFDLKVYPSPAVNGACDVTSTTEISPDNDTCYMNIENWDGVICGEEVPNTIKSTGLFSIPGCGESCGPYTPLTNVTNNACTDAVVPSGTVCDITCDVGEVAVGSAVSCQAGRYIGDLSCTTEPTAWIETVRENCSAVNPGANCDKVVTLTGPGCGEFAEIGTTCFITCGFGYFSTGTVVSVLVDGVPGWFPSPDAACVATSCGIGPALPDSTSPTSDGSGGEIAIGSAQDSYIDSSGSNVVVTQTGCNFDPINDKIIIVSREEGEDGDCGSVQGIGGNFILDCDGPSSSATALVCGNDQTLSPSLLPEFGHICVCDADFERGCANPSQFSKNGFHTEVTRAPTMAPTAEPFEARVDDACAGLSGKSAKKCAKEAEDAEFRDAGDAGTAMGKKGKTASGEDGEFRAGDDAGTTMGKKGKSVAGEDGEFRAGDDAGTTMGKKGKDAGTDGELRVDDGASMSKGKKGSAVEDDDGGLGRVSGDSGLRVGSGEQDKLGLTSLAPLSGKSKSNKKGKLTFFSAGATGSSSLKSGAYIPVVASALIVVGVAAALYKYRRSQYAAVDTVEDALERATENTPLVAM